MALTDLIPFRKPRRNDTSVVVRRETHDPFLRLQDEMNRLFESFLPGFGRTGSDWFRPFGTGGGFFPDIDLKETKKEIRVSAELPGVEEKDLDVRLDGNILTISGEKREERTENDGPWARTECCYGSFTRSIPLNTQIDSSRVKATLEKGVLKIILPKRIPAADDASRIVVKGG